MGGEFSDTFAVLPTRNSEWTYSQDFNYGPLHMADFTTIYIDNLGLYVFGGQSQGYTDVQSLTLLI